MSSNVFPFPNPLEACRKHDAAAPHCPVVERDCPMFGDIASQGRELAAHHQAIHDLSQWQQRQNGTLVRLEGKIDKLSDRMNRLFIGGLAAALAFTVKLLAAKL